MPKQLICLFTILMLQVSNVFSCVNEHQTVLSGDVIADTPHSGIVQPIVKDSSELIQKAAKYLKQYKFYGKLSYYSDYGAQLIYLGKYEEAKEVYFKINSIQSNTYAACSNLGTIYELTGNNDSAYYWIQKALEIKPSAHDSSEWIHLKILEHKVNQRANENSLLNLDFGDERKPKKPFQTDLYALRNQIYFQLKERTYFVQPKDFYVGSLYFDYGNVLALTSSLEAAIEAYEMAEEYGFQSSLLSKRKRYFKLMTLKRLPYSLGDWFIENPFAFLAIFFTVFAGTIFLITRFVWKKFGLRKNKSQTK